MNFCHITINYTLSFLLVFISFTFRFILKCSQTSFYCYSHQYLKIFILWPFSFRRRKKNKLKFSVPKTHFYGLSSFEIKLSFALDFSKGRTNLKLNIERELFHFDAKIFLMRGFWCTNQPKIWFLIENSSESFSFLSIWNSYYKNDTKRITLMMKKGAQTNIYLN